MQSAQKLKFTENQCRPKINKETPIIQSQQNKKFKKSKTKH